MSNQRTEHPAWNGERWIVKDTYHTDDDAIRGLLDLCFPGHEASILIHDLMEYFDPGENDDLLLYAHVVKSASGNRWGLNWCRSSREAASTVAMRPNRGLRRLHQGPRRP